MTAVSRLQRYRIIVEKFEALTRANIDKQIRIASFCHLVSINQRTLLRALRVTTGATPSTFVRRIRLSEARKLLEDPTTSDATISQVAMACGFVELGRFSVHYKATFGESPSETRRHALSINGLRKDDANA